MGDPNLYLCPIQVIPLHAIETTEHEEQIAQNGTLMKCPRRRLQIKTDSARPSLRLEIVLVDVVEPLLRQVDAAKNVHCP